jgi:hypothetical protein
MYKREKSIIAVPDWIPATLANHNQPLSVLSDPVALKDILSIEDVVMYCMFNDPLLPYLSSIFGVNPNQASSFIDPMANDCSAWSPEVRYTQGWADLTALVRGATALHAPILNERFYSVSAPQDTPTEVLEDMPAFYQLTDLTPQSILVTVKSKVFTASALDRNLYRHLQAAVMKKLCDTEEYADVASRVMFFDYLQHL